MKRGANSGILQEGSGLSRKILDAFAVQVEEVKGNKGDLEESVRGIIMAADAASELVDNLASIQAEMTDNHRIVNEQRQEVNKFR